MAETRDQTITGAFTIDGNTYVNIDFHGAELRYGGGVAPTFDNCRFNEARFTFRDEAANTLGFLRAMAPASTNMRGLVLGLIPELTQR